MTMTRFALLCLGLPLLGSCQSPMYVGGVGVPSDNYGMSKTHVDRAVKGRARFQVPMAVPGTSTRIIPFSMETEHSWLSDKDHFREGGLRFEVAPSNASWGTESRSRGHSLRWHNAAVHDLATGEQWSLLATRGVISYQWMLVEPEPSGEGSVRYRGMLFAVTATDSNGDGVLDDEDEIRALAVDDDGRNPRFVTPAGTRMTSVHYEEASGLAYLMVSTDEDGDGEFSEKETPRPYLYRFGENQAEPLLRAETVEAIQGAMD